MTAAQRKKQADEVVHQAKEAARKAREEEKRNKEIVRLAEEARQERLAAEKRALSHLRRKHDDVSDVTFYSHENSPRYTNSRSAICAYFGKGDNGTLEALRLKIYYVNDEWLFIGKYVIKADDQTFEIPLDYGDIKRDNGDLADGGIGIWEWYDQPMTSEQLTMIQAVIDAKKAILRYEGQQYRNDHVITSEEKKALKDVLTAYQSMGGTV